LLVALLLLDGSALYAGQASVFIYHRFADPRYPSTDISLADFRSHLQLLKERGVTVLPLGEIVERLRKGQALPQSCAAISVDDAYRSFLEDGWPLLREFGFPVTLFVSSDAVGGRDFVSWAELKELQAEGVEIGNHSAAHDYLLGRRRGEDEAAWRQRVGSDLVRSQAELTARLGVTPQLFAYPYGEYSAALKELVRNAGFSAAFAQQSGVIGATSDLYSLPRFPVGGVYATLEEFRTKLAMRPLRVTILAPQDTLLRAQNPPLLKFSLDPSEVDPESLSCYSPGGNRCQLSSHEEAGQRVYEAVAERPLTERRSKYTLTAKGRDGRSWYWFSQLWIAGSEASDHAVAR
jgi:peptidoglycan/xylan/chitin deacetylase (PgdA/CDA1 family)